MNQQGKQPKTTGWWCSQLVLGLVVALLFVMDGEVRGAVLMPAGDDASSALGATRQVTVRGTAQQLLGVFSQQQDDLSLSGLSGNVLHDLMVLCREMAADVWSVAPQGTEQDVIVFNRLPFLAQRNLSGDVAPPDIGSLTLENQSPLQPISSPPSSAVLFVPAVIGLLGVVLRARPIGTVPVGEGDAQSMEPSSTVSPSIMVLSADPDFAGAVRASLNRAGHATQLAATLDEALSWAERSVPSLLLLDHRIDNWEMLRTSPVLKSTPIMMMMPCDSSSGEEQWASELERGIDGVHDFRDGHRLFVAKVGAYLRRTGCATTTRGVYQVGAVELDADVHTVTLAGRPLQLSAKPFSILRTLMQEPSRVFSRNELVHSVWGPNFAIGEHTLDVHVHALRQQLDRDPTRSCQLVTIKGVGFKLKAETAVASSFEVSAHQPACRVAASGSDERRPSTLSRPRHDTVSQRCPSPPTQAPVLKRATRRRSVGMSRRASIVPGIGTAALAG